MIYYQYEYLDCYCIITHYFISLESFFFVERAEEYKGSRAGEKRARTGEDIISRKWKFSFKRSEWKENRVVELVTQ